MYIYIMGVAVRMLLWLYFWRKTVGWLYAHGRGCAYAITAIFTGLERLNVHMHYESGCAYAIMAIFLA